MPATVSLIERNGTSPGVTTENIANINWKAVDDPITPYTSYQAMISLGTNSFTKYHYIRFNGQFTTIGNVKITHIGGQLPSGMVLMSSPSIGLDSNKLSYNTPTRDINNTGITSFNFTPLGSSVNLLLGPQGSATDPAHGIKSSIVNNSGVPLYTNYFVSQLQVAKNSQAGSIGPIQILISYDEI
jgi:hypothetical protein